jgi:2,3-bisphosphoglycerate-dependent phosphoglycerate mutase
MSIYLIRHGETALNAARVVQPANTPLSDRGVHQAQELARRLSSVGLAGIFCSDLQRAVQTADPISAATGLTIQYSDVLQERNFGDLRGRPYDSLGFDPIAAPDAPPNGESTATFVQRVARAFSDILARYAVTGGHLAVVTHGLVVRTILERHVSLAAGSAAPERLGNTSLTIFDPVSPFRVRLVNCTAHLEGALMDDGRSLAGV